MATNPIISGKYLIVGSSKDILYALTSDGKNKVLWEQKIATKIWSNPIIIKRKYVYLSDGAGNHYLIDKETGYIKWNKKLGVVARYSQPVIYKNKLIICTIDGTVQAIKINNAKEIWRADLSCGINTSPVMTMKVRY